MVAGTAPSAIKSVVWMESGGGALTDEVADAGGQESHALLPAPRLHGVRHPDWQAGLQHRDAHVRERDGACQIPMPVRVCLSLQIKKASTRLPLGLRLYFRSAELESQLAP
ncbi:jg24708 [Pararge aegeria aegeria]|uniref:Jg24708 protein n=1 Tax=Pararge aegeria aegeria TaxID=348720 RepID=A0A8S4QS36_9NEOP|nr:jg24708 [Pararge aegeria aegeria]